VKSSDPRWIMVALRNTARFRGRACRAEVWWYVLMPALMMLAILVLDKIIYPDKAVPAPLWNSGWTIFAAALIPGIGGAIRRLHDLGRSGWWYPVLVLPVAGFVSASISNEEIISDGEMAGVLLTMVTFPLLLYWFMQRGTIGDNRFGPDPLMTDHGASPAGGAAAAHVPIPNRVEAH